MSLFLKKKIFVNSLIVAALVATVFSLVQAQEELGIPTRGVQISPARLDWDMQDGDERIGTINVKNFSAKPYQVEIEVEDFYVSDDSTEARFFVPDEKHPLAAYDVINWIETPKNLVLGPKEGKDVMFKVKVPEGTPTGGYYGAVFFRTKMQDAEVKDAEGNTSKLVVNQRVGMLLVTAVDGGQKIERSGEMLSFGPERKVFWTKPANFLIKLKNTGNLHYKVQGRFDIYKFGKRIAGQEIESRVLYPNRTRDYEQRWDFSAWSYGYYKAKAAFISEDGEIKMNGEVSFWVIPWRTTVSIIILLVIVVLILKIFSTRFEIRRKDADEPEAENDDNDQAPPAVPADELLPKQPAEDKVTILNPHQPPVMTTKRIIQMRDHVAVGSRKSNPPQSPGKKKKIV